MTILLLLTLAQAQFDLRLVIGGGYGHGYEPLSYGIESTAQGQHWLTRANVTHVKKRAWGGATSATFTAQGRVGWFRAGIHGGAMDYDEHKTVTAWTPVVGARYRSLDIELYGPDSTNYETKTLRTTWRARKWAIRWWASTARFEGESIQAIGLDIVIPIWRDQ